MDVQTKSSSGQLIRDQLSLLKLAEGFFHSNILFALLELRIFELIGEGELSPDELAREVGAEARTLVRLLNAGVVLKLLEHRASHKYALSPISRSLLLPGVKEGFIGNWIQNLGYFQTAFLKLSEAVRTSMPTVVPSRHLGMDQEQTERFTLAMHDYAVLRGRELARYLNTQGCDSILDFGCGPGTYAFYLGRANPRLRLYLMDLPGVLEITKKIQAKYPLQNELHYIPLDVLGDNIPGQYDLVLVSNTLHMLGHEASSALIRQIYHAVRQGGSLVVQAQFLRDDLMGDRWPVLLDLIQLCITTAGANHSAEQTRYWMEQAGFTDVEFCSMSLLNSNSFLRGYRK